MRKYMTGLILAAASIAMVGCEHCGRPCPPDGAAAAYGPNDSWFSRSRLFHPLAPRAAVAAPPPGAVAAPPPGAVVVPPGAIPPGAQPVVPAAPAPVSPSPPTLQIPAPDVRSYTPPADANPPTWQPSPDAGNRLVPQPVAPDRPQGSSDDRAAPPALPVGIPQFALIKKNVASGLRPTHLEGLQWLKDNGYRMALYIRPPGEADDSDRKQFEDKYGMKYASLAVSPDALTLDVVDQFNAIVSDPANRPLFVYDKDGSLAGPLWYLHFRMIDQKSDEEARAAAARIGLKEEHRDMWLAIQKILSGRR